MTGDEGRSEGARTFHDPFMRGAGRSTASLAMMRWSSTVNSASLSLRSREEEARSEAISGNLKQSQAISSNLTAPALARGEGTLRSDQKQQ